MGGPKNNQKHSWLKETHTASADVAAYYDDWAEGYNKDLEAWEYQAPIEAARLLKKKTPASGRILDAGCGTGLTGMALIKEGYTNITGIDISEKSILLAQKSGAYSRLKKVDLQEHPFPFRQSEFDAVNCIGVLAYIKEPGSLFREFCRIVRPDGYIVFSHREDLLEKYNYSEILKEFEDNGSWENIFVSDPQLYLPENENYADDIKVIYYIFRTGKAK